MAKGNKIRRANISSRSSNPMRGTAIALQQSKSEKTEGKHSALLGTFESSMTLYTLQDKIKRQPEMYKNEFKNHFEVFQNMLKEFKENPAKRDDRFEEYLKFMAHISAVYKEDLAEFLGTEIINVLQ